MTPLDLSVVPPRPASATLLGCAFLPRTIDKFRAEQPGGNPGGYFTVGGVRTMTGYLLHKLGIDPEEMRAAVAAAADEDEVAAWLRPRIDPAVAADVSEKMAAMRIADSPPDVIANLRRFYPGYEDYPDIVTFFQLFDADDAGLLGR